MKPVFLFSVLLVVAFSGFASDYYVSVDNGNNQSNGSRTAPWRDIAFAIRKLKPGDTVHVLPVPHPIVQNVNFNGVFGTPEHPIVFDGMNNIFLGVRPLNPEQWEKVSPGLYKRSRMGKINMVNRYFMVVDGRQQHMGRFNKFSEGLAPWKAPADLKPGEWTVVNSKPGDRKPHRFDLYIRLKDDAPAADIARWSEPFRCDGGIQFRGKNACVTVRNVICKQFWNDGFNIHGEAKQIVFENVAAVECGDDGISGHDGVEMVIRNYVGIGNSTGICHAKVTVLHENAYIERTLGRDLYAPKEGGTHTYKNIFIHADSRGGIWYIPTNGKVHTDHLICINRNPAAVFRIEPNANAEVTFSDCRISAFHTATPYPGVTADSAIPEKELSDFKAKLFALFQGQLEKALEHPAIQP